jgi:hypothetical protein
MPLPSIFSRQKKRKLASSSFAFFAILFLIAGVIASLNKKRLLLLSVLRISLIFTATIAFLGMILNFQDNGYIDSYLPFSFLINPACFGFEAILLSLSFFLKFNFRRAVVWISTYLSSLYYTFEYAVQNGFPAVTRTLSTGSRLADAAALTQHYTIPFYARIDFLTFACFAAAFILAIPYFGMVLRQGFVFALFEVLTIASAVLIMFVQNVAVVYPDSMNITVTGFSWKLPLIGALTNSALQSISYWVLAVSLTSILVLSTIRKFARSMPRTL